MNSLYGGLLGQQLQSSADYQRYLAGLQAQSFTTTNSIPLTPAAEKQPEPNKLLLLTEV